eukprot:UN33965
MCKEVSKMINAKPTDPTQTMTLETLNRVSKAGAGLLQWVFSMLSYFKVAADVAPRREKVKNMEKKMVKNERDLQKIQDALKKLENEISQLSKNLLKKQGELKTLKAKLEEMTRGLESAAKLIEGLS